MAVLGLILLAAAGVLTAAVVTSNTDSLAVSLWSVDVSNVTLGVVFVAGMITTVLAVVGIGLLMGGCGATAGSARSGARCSVRTSSSPSGGLHPASGPADGHDHPERRASSSPSGPDRRPAADDRTLVQPSVAVGSGPNEAPVDGSTTTQRRRSFLPRREGTTTTERARGTS